MVNGFSRMESLSSKNNKPLQKPLESGFFVAKNSKLYYNTLIKSQPY